MIKIVLTILLCSYSYKPFISTGNTFPSSGTSVDFGTPTAWTNPGNATADDGSDAVCVSGSSGSDFLQVTGFGFSLPTDATIDGVFVRIEASEHSGGTEALRARIVKAGSGQVASEKSNTNEGNLSGTSKSVYTYGSTSDLWGISISKDDVENSGFGVGFYFVTAHEVQVDYVTIAVEFTAASSRRVLIISKPAKISSPNNNTVK